MFSARSHFILPVSFFCESQYWPNQITGSIWKTKKQKNEGQKDGKAPTIVAKGERRCWHSTFHQMSLGWNWIAEHCQYLCPSANSIFESHPMGFCEAGGIVLGTELQSASLSLCWNEWQDAQGLAMKRPVDTTRRGRGSVSFSQSVRFSFNVLICWILFIHCFKIFRH